MVKVQFKQLSDMREMLIRLHMESVQRALVEQRRIDNIIQIIDSWMIENKEE